jgi:hypothetical protein
MNEDALSKMVTRLSYKTTWEHIGGVLKQWRSLCISTSVVFGALWGAAEASAYFLDVSLRGWQFFVAAIAVSILAGMGRAVYVYSHSCPSGLEKESPAAGRIAQFQRPLWEYRFARRLFQDKLVQLDRELENLLANRTLVPITRRLGVFDYSDWALARIETLRRMVNVAQRLLIKDLPNAFLSRLKQRAEPLEILFVVNQIRDLYSDTVAFERENHATETVDALAATHHLMHGWTAPIRDGIQQMNGFLDQILALDPKGNHHVEYTITFSEPPNVQEFGEELERVAGQLPDLV